MVEIKSFESATLAMLQDLEHIQTNETSTDKESNQIKSLRRYGIHK